MDMETSGCCEDIVDILNESEIDELKYLKETMAKLKKCSFPSYLGENKCFFLGKDNQCDSPSCVSVNHGGCPFRGL